MYGSILEITQLTQRLITRQTKQQWIMRPIFSDSPLKNVPFDILVSILYYGSLMWELALTKNTAISPQVPYTTSTFVQVQQTRKINKNYNKDGYILTVRPK